jgi:hypothetical protein
MPMQRKSQELSPLRVSEPWSWELEIRLHSTRVYSMLKRMHVGSPSTSTSTHSFSDSHES